MTEIAHRPRRSALYMPGANTRALEKARTLAADMLLLDLEDAVAPEAKGEAREAVCGAVTAGGYGAREVVIRVTPNGAWMTWLPPWRPGRTAFSRRRSSMAGISTGSTMP